MKDNELLVFIGDLLEEAMVHAGVAPLIVQKPLPDQQGTPTAPTVFFERMFDTPHGWAELGLSHSTESRTFTSSETQVVITHINISGRYRQDPNDLSVPTPMDLVSHVMMFVKSRYALAKFKERRASIFRITEIPNDKFENDYEQFESFPMFSIQVVHDRNISFEIPAAYSVTEDFIVGV